MKSQKINSKDFAELYFKYTPKVSSAGAAIAVVGALFKIQNWPMGSLMLTIGLATEAMIFALGIFEPDEIKSTTSSKSESSSEVGTVKDFDVNQRLDTFFQEAQIDKSVQSFKNELDQLKGKTRELNERYDNMLKALKA